jgi:hypothetical protein
MKLIINTQEEDFVKEYIPQILKEFVIKGYRDIKAKKLNDYLLGFNVKQSVRTILIEAVDNLSITKDKEDYILEVDKNKVLLNTAFNLETVVKLITYGTVDIKGYDLLLKAFDFVTKKIKTLKKMYISQNKKKGD